MLDFFCASWGRHCTVCGSLRCTSFASVKDVSRATAPKRPVVIRPVHENIRKQLGLEQKDFNDKLGPVVFQSSPDQYMKKTQTT
eukprot:450418-Amphidinium_carterae.1